ncbi:MAG: molybdopterin-dependent oxidoreductase [Thermodesulfobacteriota bacterium]
MPVLTIDDVEVHAPEGATILEAAKQADIWIPTLCWYPKISPSDSCRMCVVEIEGIERPMTSCNTVALQGMRVRTDTRKIQALREDVMKMVLMDHPLDCPVCPACGECEIQDLVHRLGISGITVEIPKRAMPVVNDWPLIAYNESLCIACGRCVKVCHEVIGASALEAKQVGYATKIGTKDGGVLNCDFCGECVEACPSGALSYKHIKSWARSWELRKVSTICPLCSVGCRMDVNVKNDRIFRVTTDLETPNRGTLCVGGRFGTGFVHHQDRLTTPLVRKHGELQPVSWEEAIRFVADNLRRIIEESGPECVAGLGSPRLTNEDAYAFQKFFRSVIGSNSVDSVARFSFLRVQRAFELTCGAKGSTSTLEDILQTNAVLLIGIDPIEETPALGWKIKTATRRYDSNLIVANARQTNVDRFAKLRLRIRPYSESDLVLGMMKIILDRELWDEKFVKEKTTHFLPMKNLLDKISLRGILRRTGVSLEQIEEAAVLFAKAPSAAVIFGGDVILQEQGLQCVMNLANLALLTGNMGREHGGLYPIFEEGNIQGLCDMGVLPEYLPGYQDAATARALFSRVWKTDLPYSKGRTAPEMAGALEKGDLRALYIVGADPLTSFPNAGRYASGLGAAELLIVQDLFLSPTAQLAHCVLPAAAFAEKDGTMTNIEHRVQKLNQVMSAPGEALPDWRILEEVATAMGRPMGYFGVRDIFREMTRTVPFLTGLKYQDTDGMGAIRQPFAESEGRLRGGKPYAFAPVTTREAPTDEITEAYPFEMMAGRSMFHFGSASTRSPYLLSLCPEGYVEINPEDASALGLSDGAPVRVSSPAGSLVSTCRLSTKIRRGLISVPTNFPDLGVYRLFEENTTVCRVKVAPADGAK